MKLYAFGPEVGRPITHYGSNFLMSGILRTGGAGGGEAGPVPGTRIPRGGLQIGCMHLGPGGLVGYHQATVPQLFLVVSGAGWVRGQAPDRLPIHPFQAAFWEAGEWHESGSDAGMVALVIEAEGIDPGAFLKEISPPASGGS